MPSEPLHETSNHVDPSVADVYSYETPNHVDPSVADVYSYETLPSGYIRYLLLQPGKSGDPIICSLHVTELEDPTPFEAISYVWGTSERTEPIECDGKTLYITVNLRNSLLTVRRVDKARALWSDSICINQADKEEKALQVSLMAEIFRRSTRTLICLGSTDAGEHAEAAAGLITAVNHMMDKVLHDKVFWEPDSFPLPHADEPLLSDPRWESVATLTGQPWFKRGWVVQEAALSPVAEIIWGGVHIGWLHFLRAYSWVQERAIIILFKFFQARFVSWLHVLHFERLLPGEHKVFRLVGYDQPPTLLEILSSGRALGVTDPRDRIYAYLSLPDSTILQGPRLKTLKPDYSKTPLQVYHDFACAYLEASGMDLDLLGHTQNFGHTHTAADCPSWVPLWDVDRYFTIYGALSRRHSSQSPDRMPSLPFLVDRNTLKVRGVRIGSVQHVTETFSMNETSKTVVRAWQEVRNLNTKLQLGNSPYYASATQAFVGTLAGGFYRGDLDEWESRQAAYMGHIQERTSQRVGGTKSRMNTPPRAEDEEDMTASMAEIHSSTMNTADGRRLVVSDRGYYGLAPFPAATGDDICIIFGTTSPFLLRQVSDASPGGTQRYKLVGDVFMLSARGAESSDRLIPLGSWEGYDDWKDWGLEEEDMLIC